MTIQRAFSLELPRGWNSIRYSSGIGLGCSYLKAWEDINHTSHVMRSEVLHVHEDAGMGVKRQVCRTNRISRVVLLALCILKC